MASSANIETVKRLTEKLKLAKSIVFMDYRGVNAPGDSDLRKVVASKEGVEYFVTKNRLFKIALKNASSDMNADEILKGPTSFIIGYEDATSAAKISKEFSKSSDVFTVKGGIIEGKVMDGPSIVEISNLPSKEVLVAQLLSQLMSPIQRLHTVLGANIAGLSRVLKNINDKK